MREWTGGPHADTSVAQQCYIGNFLDNGQADFVCNQYLNPTSYGWEIGYFHAPLPDFLTDISNGLGGDIAITYKKTPLSESLPFSLKVVSNIQVKDNGWPVSNSLFNYFDGNYNVQKKDFRGFNRVQLLKQTSEPGGYSPINYVITDTWFHQGYDTYGYAPNTDFEYLKGKPYKTRISDDSGNIYSETETFYTLKNPSPYYFGPPTQVNSYICNGNTTTSCKNSGVARMTSATYDYDTYGNITREDRYGDVGNSANKLLNMTIVRNFSPNNTGTNWLVGFPASETVYQGIGTADADKVSQTDYYYDNYSSCTSPPSTSQTPDKGNLTRIVRWLKDGTSPETRTAYDTNGYGNPVCTRDPNANVTTTVFDGTYQKFPVSISNAKGHTTSYSYYGVGTAADKGRFGQLKSITDANNATTTYEYDTFGRKTKETQPDNFWTRTAYNSFGSRDNQHIYTENQYGMWSANYLDGLGRSVKVRKSGAANKVILSKTFYDIRGQVVTTYVPYFEGTETPTYGFGQAPNTIPFYRIYQYDMLSRVTKTTNPDSTFTLACYNDLITVRIDENGHRRRETKDPLGRLVKVEEYEGVFTTCDTTQGAVYATTTYSYDVLGNLTGVSNDNQKNTTIVYDTLGRKRNMTDPDMGCWEYDYYPDGSIKTVKDANKQKTSYAIDELNRVTGKSYPLNTEVPGSIDYSSLNATYVYDETTSTNSKGYLTKMLDASGSSIYHYDKMGRPTTTVKQIDSTGYAITKSFDGMGRLNSVTYPDNETVAYEYDLGGNLTDVGNYAFFSGYNALGQPGSITFGNLATTNYWYNLNNNRLLAIKATAPDNSTLLYKNFNYDNKGNISQINDLASPVIPHNIADPNVGYTYWPDNAHRLQTASTSPGRTYLYDANGNITSDSLRTITYTPDNMPKAITMGGNTTTFTYDGNSKRVKKSNNGDRIYFGKLFECTAAGCGNYIFAGNSRIALKRPDKTLYYHPDHLGSTSIVTDQSGSKVEDIQYYPFGEKWSDTGSEELNHKYTSQELDSETQLYNYDARLYDPEIGRFLTADSIVPNYANPQSLNRYAYVLNNPLRYTDPTGHSDYDEADSIDYTPATDYTSAPNIYIPSTGGNTYNGSNSNNSGYPSTFNTTYTTQNTYSGLEPLLNSGTSTSSTYYSSLSDYVLFGQITTFGESYGPYSTDTGSDFSARLPDFISASASVTIPTPWTGTLLSWSFSGAVDRNGDVYFSPIGPGAGRAVTFVSGSLTANWLFQSNTPSSAQLSNFLSGHGVSGAVGFWGGGNVMHSPGNGMAGGVGFVSPQAGGNYSYTFQMPINIGIRW